MKCFKLFKFFCVNLLIKGSNEILPSFLGPLYLDRLNLEQKLTLLQLEVYGKFMKESGVSLLIDMRFAQNKQDDVKLKKVIEILKENGGVLDNMLVANYVKKLSVWI